MGEAVDRLVALTQVKSHTRVNKSGKVTQVREYDKRLRFEMKTNSKPPLQTMQVSLPGVGWVGELAWRADTGTILAVQVAEAHQRQGIASALFDQVKKIQPNLHHSSNLTPDGAQWAAKVPDQAK